MAGIVSGILCAAVLHLLAGAVLSQTCMNETVYQSSCADPFKNMWYNDVDFLTDICDTQEGERVFNCMKDELGCRTHQDEDTKQLFQSIFQSYDYQRLIFCEYKLDQNCSDTLRTFDCAFKINRHTEGLYGFYDLFCGNSTGYTLKRAVDCIIESADTCPHTYDYLYNFSIIRTSTRNITYGDVHRDIIGTECPKITEQNLRCMTSDMISKCNVTATSNMSQQQITCQYTKDSGMCLAQVCDDGLSNFFIDVFQYIQCRMSVLACPEDTDSRGTWPITAAGETAVIECDPGYEGSFRRQCQSSGQWANSFGSCNFITPPVNVTKELENLVKVLAKSTTKEEPTKEEISSISATLNNIAEGLQQQKDKNNLQETVKPEEAETIFEAVDRVLEPKAVEVLVGIEETEPNTQIRGGTVLGLVDNLIEATRETACSSLQSGTSSQNIKDNLLIEYGKSTSQDISFPTVNDNISSINATKAKIEIPSTTMKNLGVHDVCFAGAYYTTIDSLLQPTGLIEGTTITTQDAVVKSDVVSLKLENANGSSYQNLDPPVKINFSIVNSELENPVCAFWDFKARNGDGDWSAVGCSVKSTTGTSIICECNHLTNFCVLMSPRRISAAHAKALSIISVAGCAISMVCLLLTIFVHWLVWKLVRSDRSVVLMNLCVVLLLGLALFLAGINRTEHRAVCAAIAALLQFLFLTVFFLMLLTGIEILICLIHVFTLKFRIKLLLPISYIIPALIVAVSLGVTEGEGYGNKEFCWLDIGSGLIWEFIGPALFVIFVNFIVVLIVFKKMASTTLLKSKSTKSQIRTCVRSICVLVPVMGLTWFFGVVSVNQDAPVFSYLFAIFNTLQGLFIFLMHCVLNKHVRDALKHRQRKKKSLATLSTDLRKQSRSHSEPDVGSSPNKRKQDLIAVKAAKEKNIMTA